MADEVFKVCSQCGGSGYIYPKWRNGLPDTQQALPCQNYHCSGGKVLDEGATAARRQARLARAEEEQRRKQQSAAVQRPTRQRDEPPPIWKRRRPAASNSQFDWLIASLFFVGSFYPITAIFKPTKEDVNAALVGMAVVGVVAGFNGQLIRTILKTAFAIVLVIIVASKFGPEPNAAKPAASEQPLLAASAFSYSAPKEKTKPKTEEEKKWEAFFDAQIKYLRAKEAGETGLVRPTWSPDAATATSSKPEVDTSFDWMDYSALTLVSLGSLFLGLLVIAGPKPR